MKLNPQDVHMNTPLHFCCNNGHMESATLLMIVSVALFYNSMFMTRLIRKHIDPKVCATVIISR